MNPVSSAQMPALKGVVNIPGDKSISHRSLMFGALAIGETVIHGLLEGEDVLATAAAMRAMGATISKDGQGVWRVNGVGVGGLHQPDHDLDMGNSGTSTRLLMGLVGGHNMRARFVGDASLTKRPMQRVMTPLEQMGIQFEAAEGGKLPLTVIGAEQCIPAHYRLPVASAQVKSAILLAGLNAPGTTTVIEEKKTRDHTENMLRHFGVDVQVDDMDDGAQAIHLLGQQEMHASEIHVPADPSSAAFPAVAALITKGSEITLKNIGMNERRNGIYTTLIEMGADIRFENERLEGGEKTADLVIKSSSLKGIDVPADRVPSMIDEFPVLFVAASFANGTTRMTGLEELRVKESDRLGLMAEGLRACGVELEMGADSMIIHGTGEPPKGGAEIETALDHRIAMSFLVMGCASKEPVSVDDRTPILTSFPNFIDLMNGLGARIA